MRVAREMGPRQFAEVVEFAVKQPSVCGRKYQFPSRRAAKASRKLMGRRGVPDVDGLEAYHCRWCSGWHLGRPSGAPWER